MTMKYSDRLSPPPALGRQGGHEPFRDLLADAGQKDLSALRHLLTCPLCRQLARMVLLEMPAFEHTGGGRRRHRQPLRHRS
jgi:hypothetical protein